MKKNSNILWGIVLVAAGVIFALNAFEITNIDIFFDGWWTLIIIIPCFINLFKEKEKTGNLIGIAIGVFLLLCCQDILSFEMLWKLAVPVIIVLVGIKLICSGIFNKKSDETMKKIKEAGGQLKAGTAVFSGATLNCQGESFCGAELNAIFGGVKCDLRDALIDQDCVINAWAVFGGVDILVPDDVNVKINSTSIFGGSSDKRKNRSNSNPYTLYINAVCLFGGLDVK